jgi:cell division protein FtsI (penicillin-binding protein 3)
MPRESKLYLFFAVFISLAFILLIYRAYIIQIIRHDKLQEYSTNDEVVKVIKGKRGTIYDRNGEPLAVSESKIDIAVDSKNIIEKDEMAVIISKSLKQDIKKVHEILNRGGHFYYLLKNAEYESVKGLKEQKNSVRKKLKEMKASKEINKELEDKYLNMLRDFGFIIYLEGYQRTYPQGKMLANVLGFVQRNDDVGLEGIEMSYDKFLAGLEKKLRRLTIPSTGESTLEIEKELDTSSSADIYLTIDSRIQFIAEEELTKMMLKTKANWGGVVVMEPATGKILAMANYPTYEPDRYFKYSPKERRNYTIANLFEPGSTFKVFSILAVLNENLAKPGEMIFGENGRFSFGRRWVRDSHPYEWMTIRDIVINSSNIGTIKLADRLSREQLYDYFTAFGFGTKTKINLPGESFKPIRPAAKWYPIDKGNISFGQGISVNMVQMARAYASIYNGGVLWQPVIVDRIVNPNNEKILFQTVPEPKRINFKFSSDKRMVGMLEGVVEEGTAKSAMLEGIKVGGKTGTSQIYDFAAKKYSWDNVVCSFIGAVPSNDPAFVIMVVIEQPEGREFGGTVAAPVFKNIAARSLPLYGIYVDRKAKDKSIIPDMPGKDITGIAVEASSEKEDGEGGAMDFIKIPNFINSDSTKALQSANKTGLDVLFSGDPSRKIVNQYPGPGEFVPFGTVIMLETEEPQINENN